MRVIPIQPNLQKSDLPPPLDFHTRLPKHLVHIEVMTKVSSLEKNQPYKDDEIPVMEMFEMDAITPIAKAFMDLE